MNDAEPPAPADPPVRLRRATPEDTDLILGWRREPSARRYQPLRQLSAEELRELLAERAARALGPAVEGELQWVIETPEGPAGWVTLVVTSREHGIGTVGYTVGERLRGRGFATAGLRALLPLAFAPEGADLARLEAVAAVENVASCRVLERCGFRWEGVARGYVVIGGERVDHARYGLLRTEWFGE